MKGGGSTLVTAVLTPMFAPCVASIVMTSSGLPSFAPMARYVDRTATVSGTFFGHRISEAYVAHVCMCPAHLHHRVAP